MSIQVNQKITENDVTTALGGKAPKVHAHGNLTNGGAIGNEPNKLVATTTGGLVTTADSLSASSLAAGSAPTVSLSNGTLTFGIPKGNKGSKGDKGDTGNTGAKGATGATGAKGPIGYRGSSGLSIGGGTGNRGWQKFTSGHVIMWWTVSISGKSEHNLQLPYTGIFNYGYGIQMIGDARTDHAAWYINTNSYGCKQATSGTYTYNFIAIGS